MKKNLVHEEVKVLQEKKEYYKQRKMTAYFERLNMIKKQYGKYSPEAINMERIYIEKYGNKDGLTIEGFGNYQEHTEGFVNNQQHTYGFGNSEEHTHGFGSNKEDTEGFGNIK